MKFRVRKPFRYAIDGIHIVKLAPGSEREFGPESDGLVAAGLIEAVADKAAAAEKPAEDDKVGHEEQGTAYDKDAVGHELVGRETKPKRGRATKE